MEGRAPQLSDRPPLVLPPLHVIDRPAEGAEDASLTAGSSKPPLVVLVHGSMDRATSFGRVDRNLPDLHVVRYDRRGYGRSMARGPGGIAAHVDDLLEVLDGRSAVLVGHSLGGVVVLAAAQRRPEQALAVLAYETPTPWASWWPRSSMGSQALSEDDAAAAAERFMVRSIGEARWARLPAKTRQQRRAEGPALVAELASIHQDGPPFDPTKITVPVISGHSTGSAARHIQAAHELAERAPGAQRRVIEGADHGAHLSHPRAFAALVREAVTIADR